MEVLPPALEGLKAYKQFVVYQIFPKENGKTDKITINPHTGNKHDAHDPAIWYTADEAIQCAKALKAHVGFTFTKDDPFFFLDIDGCKQDDGRWNQTAEYFCTQFQGCAVEVSNSGKGLHVIGQADYINHKTRNDEYGLELYTSGRFVALTGFEAMGDVNFRVNGQFMQTVTQYFPPAVQGDIPDWTTEPCEGWKGPKDDEQLIKKMLSSMSVKATLGGTASLKDLWECNVEVLISSYPDRTGNNPFNHSAADQALCNHLAFWTGKDCERIERLFSVSGLNRDKWESREEYRVSTILGALAVCDKVYRDDHNKKVPPEQVDGDPGPIINPEEQKEHFRGCVYVTNRHQIYDANKLEYLDPPRFKAERGGYSFVLDPYGQKITDDAFKVFTLSQAVRFTKVWDTCFRPDLSHCDTVVEDGKTYLNGYKKYEYRRVEGDPTPFLDHIKLLLPDERDRVILLSYLAAFAQHPGVKFRWAYLLQGAEGNGKTSIIAGVVKHIVGKRHAHECNPSDLGNKFNAWIEGKLFANVEEVYASNKRELIEALKPLITNDDLEIQGKKANQYMGSNYANFLLFSNHKDAIPKTRGDRRYCVNHAAQQTADDVAAMGSGYFLKLMRWFKADGAAIAANYLCTYPIPEEFNPATTCFRAPATSSTVEAIEYNLPPLQQDITSAADEGRPGFIGGYVSSIVLQALIADNRYRMNRNKIPEILREMGYISHPGLKAGRTTKSIMSEGSKKPRIYIKRDHPDCALQGAAAVAAYEKVQGYV